jgi:ATP-dependent DNA ligase
MSDAPAPMEALLVAELPEAAGWQYEPKWDGFRCIAVHDGGEVALWSKSGKPLGRYFPEVVAMIARLGADQVTIDGELVIESAAGLSFDALQMRLHPAESRINRLAAETPATFIAFDLLRAGGKDLSKLPLAERRKRLVALLGGEDQAALLLSPATTDRAAALEWLARTGGDLDGVIGKRLDDAYRPGERAMVKVKQHRSADCVVGGFRYDSAKANMASLLLGLYDDAGKLDHVGFCSSFSAAEKAAWTPELEALIEAPGFTGSRPDKPSRWNRDKAPEWQPLRPEIVVEVMYDQVTSGRFRHGTRLLRRRPDKAPEQCRAEQLRHALTPAELHGLLGR